MLSCSLTDVANSMAGEGKSTQNALFFVVFLSSTCLLSSAVMCHIMLLNASPTAFFSSNYICLKLRLTCVPLL